MVKFESKDGQCMASGSELNSIPSVVHLPVLGCVVKDADAKEARCRTVFL